MKLTQSTTTLKKTLKGTITQDLVTTCEYDPYEQEIDQVEVHMYQDGKHLAEISDLLDDAEGDLLSLHLDSINWYEIYIDTVESKREMEYENSND